MKYSDQVSKIKEAIKRGPPIDLLSLAESLGAKVHAAFLSDEISGMIECVDGGYTISYNATHPQTRQRFTLAHEIGHLFLHKGLIGDGLDDNIAYRSTDSGKYHNTNIGPVEETEANRFAAAILMPKHQLEAYIEKNPSATVDQIAYIFGVSRESMNYRLKGLGLLHEQS